MKDLPEPIEQLYYALKDGKKASVTIWKKKNGDIPQETALFYAACEGGFTEIAEELITLIDDVNKPARESAFANPPLHVACENGCVGVIKLLLKHGASPEGRMDSSTPPLYEAVKGGSLEAVETLLDRGADMNRLCSYFGQWLTVFDFSYFTKNNFTTQKIAEVLMLRNPLNLQQRAERKIRDLHEMMFKSPMSEDHLFRFIFEYGCDINYTDDDGNTLLHRVVLNDMDSSFSEQHIRFRIKYGADPYIRNKKGESVYDLSTPKIVSWINKKPEIFKPVERIQHLLRPGSTKKECNIAMKLLNKCEALQDAVDKHEIIRLQKLNTTESSELVEKIQKVQGELDSLKELCPKCLRYTLRQGRRSNSDHSLTHSFEPKFGYNCVSCGYKCSF